MRILSLDLKNIGPFIDGHIEFVPDQYSGKPPVVIITGENGTGKTIILDAIRALFLSNYKIQKIGRDIVRSSDDHLAKLTIENQSKIETISSSKLDKKPGLKLDSHNNLINRFSQNSQPDSTWNWVIDYWTSKSSSDSFNLTNLATPIIENVYKEALDGVQKNVEASQLICFFDYLKSSENAEEVEVGKKLFEILKKIVKASLITGEFKYVSRLTLQPIVSQMGQEVSLDKLSSGNLYLIQRMVSLLGKMYCLHVLNQNSVEQLCKLPGILMIDEAENHLHPKWQKTFLQSIQEIFPNLQIIATTHSPFIVSSVDNAKIFVCKSKGDHAEVVDETDVYSNMPIEEILLSPLFGATYPFNQHITELLQARKKAINQGERDRKQQIEKALLEINPQYFNYFNVDTILENITV